jgi:hypothetical protein
LLTTSIGLEYKLMATKKKFEKQQRKVKTIDMNKYSPVITVDAEGVRKFDAEVGDYVVVERFASTGNTFNVCLVKGFYVEQNDERAVKLWDDTRGQWFYFSYDAVNVPNIYKVK